MSQPRALRPGLLWLIRPKLRSKVNRARTDEARVFKTFLLGFVGLFFWAFIFMVIFRMLLYFRGTQGIGDLLASKLLGLAFLTFFSILLLSNVITALSTFFLSDDLELIVAAPVDPLKVYGARLCETIVDSSWMVALMAVPLLTAYGVIYSAGPLYYALAVLTAYGVIYSAGPLFYVLAVLTTAAFLVVPAVIGAAVTLLLVSVFPARRARDLLALIGLFAAAGLVTLFRVLRPERLVRPEDFRSLVDFVAVLRTPTSAWLPNEWAADALMSWLAGTFDPFPFFFLWSTAAAFVVLGGWVHVSHYARGFTRAQEGADRRAGGRRMKWVDLLVSPASPRTRALVSKELKVFFRDSTQWSQLILLAVLVVVYVYNIRVLPLYTGEQVSFFLINLVSFLNLGLAGFVVAAIAARFVFPAMSLEGRMLWLLKSSPLDVRKLFWTKYWVGTVPLLMVAMPLIVFTNFALKASPFIMGLTTVTMIGVTCALTALALAFGALYPNFDTENAAEIPTSFGGLLFMMAAVLYLAGVVALEAWPVYVFLTERLRAGAGGSVGLVPLALGLAGAALLTAAAVVVPLEVGVRRVEKLEL